MSEWWTYTLADLLMFSPRTYYRLIERYNIALWPGQLLALGLGVLVAALWRRPGTRSDRAIAAVLAAAWAWVGWAFLYERYADINWAARWFAVLFAVEALLLGWAAARPTPASHPCSRVRSAAGIAIIALGLAVYPLLGPMLGRGWTGVEVFGLMPEPTALVTIGIVLTGAGRTVLLVVPLVWLVIGGLTLGAMGSPEAWVVALSLVVALAAPLWARLGARPVGSSA